jgi:type IV pilus assembly protein PilV
MKKAAIPASVCARPDRRQQGFSFFEVLIAALVLGIAVLGFAGLQVRALDSTGLAHFRAQAVILAADIAERIRQNPGQLAAYLDENLWDESITPLPDGAPAEWTVGDETCIYGAVAAGGCTDATFVSYDALEIRFLANELLPAGNVQVRECDLGSGLTCVFVAWRGLQAADCDFADPQDDCVGLEVLL